MSVDTAARNFYLGREDEHTNYVTLFEIKVECANIYKFCISSFL